MIELQRCTDKDQWNDFILENHGHPLQLWEWGQLKAGHGWSVQRIFAFDGDEIVAAAQVLLRRLPSPLRRFAYVPRGPVGDEAYGEEFLKQLAALVKRDYKAVTLSVEPDSTTLAKPAGWVQSTNTVLARETILLDLEKSESDLLAVMAKKTRQYIRKSSSQVMIKPVKTREALLECLDLYKQTALRAGFNLHSQQYYLDVQAQMRDFSPIFAAYVDDRPVAFLWLAISGETGYELYGGMSDEGQSLRANYALKWYAIRKLKEWGLRRYDFGGLVAGGVSVFKQQWADATTVMVGAYDAPLSPFYVLWSKGLPFAKRVSQKIRRKKS